MRKIFIDCSYLYDHKELNTGIQRVVRRVIENLDILSENGKFEVIPVNISNNQFFRVDIQSLYTQNLTEEVEQTPKIKYKIIVKDYLKNVYKALRHLIAVLFPFQKVKNFVYASRDTFGLNYIVDRLFMKPIKYLLAKKVVENTSNVELVINEDDILLLLDSTWYLNIWPTVAMAKENGAKIIAVIYDLIPITHSQFCDDFLVEVFKTWFKDSLNYVDGYIAISDTVRKDLISFLNVDFAEKVKGKEFDYFLLGSDFSSQNMEKVQVREQLNKMYQGRSTYLIVCTVEPRKNHQYLLDVFDKLWEKDIDVNLCIVGKIGWKVEQITDRINNHQLLNKKLFIWSDLNDKELLFCYQNSKMLLFPSIVEGFGLPIVESLTNHLPVLASDTPIHREVGKDQIGYFDLNDTNDLVKQLVQIEEHGIQKDKVPSADYRWKSWYESTQMLLEKIMKMSIQKF